MHCERDKFLYEAMGIKASFLLGDYKTQLDQKARTMNGFSSWLEFGLLWDWCQKQPWWTKFVSKWTDYDDILDLINPDKLADAVYTYLRNTANTISMEQVGEVKYK